VARETIYATLIVIVLVGLSLYFGRQQQQSLRWLREQPDLPPEDQRYYRRQAWLRLVNCGLMLLLAVLVGVYYIGFDARVAALAELIQARQERHEQVPLDAEQLQLRRLFAGFCFTVLIILMTIVFLVAVDIWAIRRYGRRHLRQINADRRAMIDDQLSRMRSERNGHA
jgi:hypothetical protein